MIKIESHLQIKWISWTGRDEKAYWCTVIVCWWGDINPLLYGVENFDLHVNVNDWNELRVTCKENTVTGTLVYLELL